MRELQYRPNIPIIINVVLKIFIVVMGSLKYQKPIIEVITVPTPDHTAYTMLSPKVRITIVFRENEIA